MTSKRHKPEEIVEKASAGGRADGARASGSGGGSNDIRPTGRRSQSLEKELLGKIAACRS
jgi:hypothetical protein